MTHTENRSIFDAGFMHPGNIGGFFYFLTHHLFLVGIFGSGSSVPFTLQQVVILRPPVVIDATTEQPLLDEG